MRAVNAFRPIELKGKRAYLRVGSRELEEDQKTSKKSKKLCLNQSRLIKARKSKNQPSLANVIYYKYRVVSYKFFNYKEKKTNKKLTNKKKEKEEKQKTQTSRSLPIYFLLIVIRSY